MPDWFYRTLGRPLLFALPGDLGRRLAVGTLGRLSRLPGGFGLHVIDFLGHMHPDARLRCGWGRQVLRGPVGLACLVDPEAAAVEAWERFGIGILEVGPVSTGPSAPYQLRRDDSNRALLELGHGSTAWTPSLAQRLSRLAQSGTMPLVRQRAVRGPSGWEVPPLPGFPTAQAGVVIDVTGTASDQLAEILKSTSGVHRPEPDPRPARLAAIWAQDCTPTVLEVVRQHGIDGLVLVAARRHPVGRHHGPGYLDDLRHAVRLARSGPGRRLHVVASGAAEEPEHVADLIEAGADAVLLDAGFVFHGPGLVARSNEAVLAKAHWARPPVPIPRRAPGQSWFWLAMLGLAMFAGGILAVAIAATRVVLPYDEAFCGWNRREILGFNPRLLDFLAHDRVSLAGTMICIGTMYAGLAWWGVRRGLDWARQAILVSGGIGFATFFLFLGFGYFDPFHGFVTSILFQLFVLGLFAAPSQDRPPPAPEWHEDGAWRRARWGQLLLLLHAAGLLLAGTVIASIGVGEVFVESDLVFLQSQLGALQQANPRLVPLIAHDRATLGGMLICSGVVYLLAALRGVKRDHGWLWMLSLLGGLGAYGCAITIHFKVGYVDPFHLAPAVAGLALLVLGLALIRDEVFLLPRRPGAEVPPRPTASTETPVPPA